MKKNATMEAREKFRKELRDLINKYGLDEECNTPDHLLADLLLSMYDSYALHVARRDEAVGFLDSSEEEDEEEQPDSKRGYIVIKDEKPLTHTVFVEWRNKQPIYSNCADNAMVFVHRPIAEHVAGKLGDGWYVLNLDELWRESDKARRLIDAIFRTVDDLEDDDEEE